MHCRALLAVLFFCALLSKFNTVCWLELINCETALNLIPYFVKPICFLWNYLYSFRNYLRSSNFPQKYFFFFRKGALHCHNVMTDQLKCWYVIYLCLAIRLYHYIIISKFIKSRSLWRCCWFERLSICDSKCFWSVVLDRKRLKASVVV